MTTGPLPAEGPPNPLSEKSSELDLSDRVDEHGDSRAQSSRTNQTN